MKLKFDKIENENFILKSLRFQKEKTFHFGTCYDKHKNILSFKIHFTFMLTKYICDVVFNFKNNSLTIFSNNNNNKDLYYTEQLNKQNTKNFNLQEYINTSIPESTYAMQLYKDNIIRSIKHIIQNNITSITNSILLIPTETYIVSQYTALSDFQKIVNNINITNSFQTKNEFDSLLHKVNTFMSTFKDSIVSKLESLMLEHKPQYLFEINVNKSKQYYHTKPNEKILYKSQSQIILITFSKGIHIEYNNIQQKTSLYIEYKSKHDFTLQLIGKLIIVNKPTFCFCGVLKDTTQEMQFGIEIQKNFTYLGHYKNDLYEGKGILFTNIYKYIGNFTKGAKDDTQCLILFNNVNHLYKGGIKKNEFFGNGNYCIQNEYSFSGMFNKGDIDGKVKFTFENGDVFEGEMVGGVKKNEWVYLQNNKVVMKANYDNEKGTIYKY
jgi:hypothetical protein